MSRKKRSSRGYKKRMRILKILIGGILIFGILFLSSPYLKHIMAFRGAIDRYDFMALSQELTWMEDKADWLKKVPAIREGELWLKLNQGNHQDLEADLLQYDDDTQRFWLFQLYCLQGKLGEAESMIHTFKSLPLQRLAEGLLWYEEESYEEAEKVLLTINDTDLNREEQVLKNIALTRSLMASGDLERAQKSWQSASEISSAHPQVLATEYDLALNLGQWDRAKELSRQLVGTDNISYTQQLLVKKAILSLVIGERKSYEDTLKEIEKLEDGEACLQYLAGIEEYEHGDFVKAAEHLQGALDRGLPQFVVKDATIALQQAGERIAAEKALSKVIGN